MKKSIMALMAMLALVFFTACGANDTEKKLNGKWQTQEMKQGMELTLAMELNADTHDALVSISVGMQGIDLFTTEVKGSWSASEKELSMELDEKSIAINFSEDFKALSGLTGAALDQYKEQALGQMKTEFNGLSKEEIVTLTDQTLTLKEKGAPVTFTRVN